MAKEIKNKIETQGFEISILTQDNDDYISLTDIAKYKNPDEPTLVISNWLSNYSTIDFLAVWEELNNPNFKPLEFQGLRNERGRLSLSSKQWIERVGAIGLRSKAGRYGGTYAHSDIALEFASWVSAEFKLYVIKEYQRLKQSESYQEQIEWSVRRELSKLNYTVHTDAIKEFLISEDLSKSEIGYTYATEADLLNMALFGLTAKQFKERYPEQAKKGNLREQASTEQLIILGILEANNALMIEQGLSKVKRLETLRKTASEKIQSVIASKATERIKRLE